MSLLTCHEVTVAFGGVRALDGVSLDVAPESITGLIGPNGAGKTTLFNAVTGLQRISRGSIAIDGVDVTNVRAERRARLGIARTFQRLETFGSLSVRENVLVAAELQHRWSRARVNAADLADDLVDRVGLSGLANERVDTLPTGTQRLVEVARALATKPRLLLLDEPSSGLNEMETRSLAALLRDVAATGLGILLVEHDMGLVMDACDQIHVLDFGRVIAAGTPAEIQGDGAVRAAYLGEGGHDAEVPNDQRELVHAVVAEPAADPPTPVSAAAAGSSDCALQLDDVRAAYGVISVVDGVSLRLKSGDVLALLGPNGAGKTSTIKVASGQLAATSGSVSLHGVDVTAWTPDRRARSGLCVIPEGRGVFPNLTVLENLRMITYSGAPRAEVEERAFLRFPVLADRRTQVAGTLSGGEQQMLAMARAMATDPRVLILDELSMGLAPLVVEELYEVVRRVAAEDVAILIVEQFAHEVLGVADSAAIMVGGRIEHKGAPDEIAARLHDAYLGGAAAR